MEYRRSLTLRNVFRGEQDLIKHTYGSFLALVNINRSTNIHSRAEHDTRVGEMKHRGHLPPGYLKQTNPEALSKA